VGKSKVPGSRSWIKTLVVMSKAPIQDKVSEWTLGIWVIVVIVAVVINYLRGH